MLGALVRLAFWSAAALGVTALVVVKALRAMRAGEPYTFGFLDGGLLLYGKSVSPRLMIGVAAAYLVLVGGILAWPLGLYDWIGERTSACRDIVTDDELAQLGGEDFVDELRVQELGTMCSERASVLEPEYVRFEVEIEPWLGHGRNIDARASELRATPQIVRAPSGAPITRADTEREAHLFVTSGHAAAHLVLSRTRFTEDEIGRVVALADARRDLIAPYGERAESRAPSAWRRYLPYLFLAVVFLTLVGGVSFVVVRRNRALKRVLEEDDVDGGGSDA